MTAFDRPFLSILSASVLLGATTAFAGSGNDADIGQFGTDHSAAVDQSAGSENDATILQTDRNNSTDITHSGDYNTSIVTQAGRNGEAADTVSGDGNTLSITQTSYDNISANMVSGDDNKVAIIQQGGNLGRRTWGNTSSVTISNDADANILSITQDGEHTSAVTISGAGSNGNTVTIDQGQISRVLRKNTSTVFITGADNDVDVDQNGSNTSAVTISGGTSSFGNTIEIDQWGFGSDSTATVEGGGNTLTVSQFVAGNNSNAEIFGNRNSLTVGQFGAYNKSTAKLTGDDNSVSVTQVVLGNTSDITINGGTNQLNVLQAGFGGGDNGRNNKVLVDIYGHSNNAGDFDPALSAALEASDLAAGDLVQFGTNNLIDLNVGTTFSDSSSNTFAFGQYGSDNEIYVTIKGGSGNQAVIVQGGDNNFASLTQNGSNNIAGISQ